MAKTDIWMPLYIADYLADTMRLTTEQHGAYLLLIMDYWRNGPLPDDDASLSSITKLSASVWRKYRPVFEKLFKVDDGEWRHKRIDEELLEAKTNSDKYANRARKAANKRWGKQEENASSSNASSIPQASLNECTSPTPTPSNLKPDVTHTESITPINQDEPADQARVFQHPSIEPSAAGLCCQAMRKQGITNCNSHHPTLLELLKAGATEDEFAHAARNAVDKGKSNFAYVIGTVKRQREEAAKLVLHQGRMPNKQEAIEESNRAATAGWLPPELRGIKHAN